MRRYHSGVLAAVSLAAAGITCATAQDADNESDVATSREQATGALRAHPRRVTGTVGIGAPRDAASIAGRTEREEPDLVPELRMRMYTAARESTVRERNLATAILHVQRQVEDDNLDIAERIDITSLFRRRHGGGTTAPRWNVDIDWHSSAPPGVREIEYWFGGDEDHRSLSVTDEDFSTSLHGATPGGAPGRTVFWRYRDLGAQSWSAVQYDRALPVRDWPQVDLNVVVALNWRAVPNAHRYELRFGRDGADSEFRVAEAPDPGVRVTFTPYGAGVYDWEVIAYDADDHEIRQAANFTDSEGRVLHVGDNGSLSAEPEPFEVHIDDLQLVDRAISWASAPGVDRYNVAVSLSDDFSLPENDDAPASDLLIVRRDWPGEDLTLRGVPQGFVFHVRVEPVLADGSVGAANVFTVSTAAGGPRD